MHSQNTTAAQRLQQTLSHIRPLSILHGPKNPPLIDLTLSALLEEQAERFFDKECCVFPWTGARWTYGRLQEESNVLATGLLALGVRHGDRVSIMAGNCEQYVAVLFGAARIGAIVVVLNNTYTEKELRYALEHTETKILFITPTIGRHSNAHFLNSMRNRPRSSLVEHIITLRGLSDSYATYDDLLVYGARTPYEALIAAESLVSSHDVANLQFTSGSTGFPKAAMLTHHNIINNSRFIGDRMALTPSDILCSPPPLFHCFGLVLGLLACMTHGSTIVFPSEVFSASAVLAALDTERCTALHGVPAMFTELLSLPRPRSFVTENLRTGIIAGAPVPRPLMEQLFNELGMEEYTSSYGLTEASPTCFNAFVDTPLEKRLTTVGKILPHISAKIADPRTGRILPRGEKGELCIAGYALQKGYWRNLEKTKEAMRRDEDGVLWLHTGDEACFDEEGYCKITGRFKDIIIRGGENIYPLEIEERLIKHPAIAQASVIGVQHEKYGEVVGAFLEAVEGQRRPGDEEVREWVRETLARYKAPAHVFWMGGDGVLKTWPTTGSGKILKPELRRCAEAVVTMRAGRKQT